MVARPTLIRPLAPPDPAAERRRRYDPRMPDDATPTAALPTTNRQVRLARRPHGPVTSDCFELAEAPVSALEEGQALLAVDYLSIDPTIRGWMERDTYLPAIPLGAPIRSGGIGHVIASRNEQYPVGAMVFGMPGWQEYAVLGPETQGMVVPDGIDPLDTLSVYGSTGMTAYFGLLDIGRPQDGDTVLVSGAAGATGSIVGQIAKLAECRVVGIAGGPEKCRRLTEELGFDAAIDYRSEDVGARIGELCPDGVDIFFDNVGGDILEAALDHLALGARVVLCGAISTYNDVEPRPGPRNLMNLVVQRARMEGFLVLDYVDRFAEAALQLGIWVAEGRIRHRADVVEGLEHAPEALDRLFSGANTGKVVVKVSA